MQNHKQTQNLLGQESVELERFHLKVLQFMNIVCVFSAVWFRVKLHIKDAKTALDKKRYVAFWLERYAKREPGMPLTVVFDMSESSIGNIVSIFIKLNMF